MRQPQRYYIAAGILLVALALIFGVVQCGVDEEEVTAPAPVVELQETVPALEAPTTTTTAVVAPTTEAPAPVVTEAPAEQLPHEEPEPTPEPELEPLKPLEEPEPEPAYPQQSGYTASWFGTGRNGYYAARGEGSPFPRGAELLVCHGDACVNVIVNDFCVGCGSGKLDLSDEAFSALSPLSVGIIDITVAQVG